MGIGDWAQSPIPNPQSPIPNPQSPFVIINDNYKRNILYNYQKIKYYFKLWLLINGLDFQHQIIIV